MRLPKTIIAIILPVLLVILFLQCQPPVVTYHDPRGDAYVGMNTCISCHKTLHDEYLHSNHYKTSSVINPDSLRYKVTAPGHSYTYPDGGHIDIEEKNGQFVQGYNLHGKDTLSAQFAIAFGSGEKAQTYGYWKGDQLLELPLTYFRVMHTWINSPGFPVYRAYFSRVIESRCFECHATYVNKTTVQSAALQVQEKLDKNTFLMGIDCERCHGPGAEHVAWQQEHPNEHKTMYMTAIRSLSRQQQLDLCATCHSGNDRGEQQTIFAFQPGDTLSNYYFPDFGTSREPDVHGRQLQLLQASQCFQRSQLTCNSCHGAHENERNNLSVFIGKCMQCHQSSGHSQDMLKKQAGNLTAANCIDCHMPLQPSRAINFSNGMEQKPIPYLLRTHRIAIY